MITVYSKDYDEQMKKYNKKGSELAEQRRKFYEENPNFPYKTMYLNVISPPQKFIIIEH